MLEEGKHIIWYLVTKAGEEAAEGMDSINTVLGQGCQGCCLAAGATAARDGWMVLQLSSSLPY